LEKGGAMGTSSQEAGWLVGSHSVQKTCQPDWVGPGHKTMKTTEYNKTLGLRPPQGTNSQKVRQSNGPSSTAKRVCQQKGKILGCWKSSIEKKGLMKRVGGKRPRRSTCKHETDCNRPGHQRNVKEKETLRLWEQKSPARQK